MSSLASMTNGNRPKSALESEVEKRFGVLPNFFRLCPESPQITANLWGFAKFAYLDNPLPSLFKERLFVHLSRFCEVRYCIARHVGFLVGLGRPSGDPQARICTVEEVVSLLQRPFPRGAELDTYFGVSKGIPSFQEVPETNDAIEKVIFAFAGHVFLRTTGAERSEQELRRLFGAKNFQNLALFLTFVRAAHYWTEIHGELEFESDVNELVAAHEVLANCILKDPESGVVGQRIIDELHFLRQNAGRAGILLTSIVESSEDAIISKTLDGVITSWNKSAERLFGYSAEEAIGQSIALIIPATRLHEETEIINSLKLGKRIDHFETVRRRKDGSLITVSLTVSPLCDPSGKVIGASKIARDIGTRVRTERALTEKARLLDLSNDAIIVRDGLDRIIYWNKGATEIYGYSPEEALGRVTHELFSTIFPEPIDAVWQKLLRDGRWSGELIHRRKGGREIVVDSRWVVDANSDGRPSSILETNNDITRQKLNEQALRESDERLRAANDSLETKVLERTRELEKRNAEVADLSMRLLRTQDDERRHIARELHDSAGQTLTVMGMKIQRLIQKTKNNALPELVADQEAIRNLMEKLNQEIRTNSYLLHPPLLDESGLTAALPWYVRGLSERSGLSIQLSMSETIGRPPQDLELVIFRLIQECLTNIHRHSGSNTAVIRIDREGDRITVNVSDQGKGMPPERLAEIQEGGAGVGVRGMRERVRHFNGEMKIDSSNSGTTVSFAFPIKSRALAARLNRATV